MTEFENMVADSLRSRLDAIGSSGDLPPKVAWRAKRGRLLTASTAAMSLILVLGGGVVVGAGALERVFQPAGHSACPFLPRVDLKIYLKDAATRDHVEEIEFLLSARDEVQRFEFVSKKEAYAEFKQAYIDLPEYYANLPRNALPARFDVDLKGGVDPDAFSRSFPRIAIDEVRFAGDFVDHLCGDYEP